MGTKKTLEQHKTYLHESIKLSLWFIADWKNKNPKEDIIWIIHERTSLVNLTIFNPKSMFDVPSFEGDKWPKMRLELRKLYEENNSPNSFEKKGYNLLKPYIDDRAERDLTEINGNDTFNQYQNNWLRYDPKDKSEYLEIHMANTLYPDSFLADDEYFYKGLISCIKFAEENGYLGIRTTSWLNDLPSWQEKMPKEWNNSITNRSWDVEWHLGFWGQFLTANQCFNSKLGQIFRDSGKIPFPMSKAQAKISSFKQLFDTLQIHYK